MKIAPLIGFPGRKLTSTTIKQNLQNDTVQLKTLLAIEEKFHTDIIFYFMDLSVESEALGLKIDFPEDEAPSVIEHPVRDLETFTQFKKLDSVYALSLDSDIDLGEAYNKTQKMVIGNINPVTVASASKEKITSEINSLTKKMEGISDFILSTGCDLPPETPIENISLFFD